MITTDEKVLRIPCQDATIEEAGELIKKLEKELAFSAIVGRNGIGLAAPQINIHKKVAIIRIDKNLSVNLVNARILKSYDERLFVDEGCLSFPDRKENTMRFQEIEVRNSVEPHSFIATGLLAVAIQHELDHLNSILLPDRAITTPLPKKEPRK